MTPDIYWIRDLEPLRLAVMPRPRSGEWLGDEIAGLDRAGVRVVVSLLEAGEVRELELDAEAEFCQRHGIEYLSFPIPDRGVPVSMSEARSLVERIVQRLKEGSAVAIHCRAGIGRSGLIASCVLAVLGTKPAEALIQVSKARGVRVPDTPAQEEWLTKFHRVTDHVPTLAAERFHDDEVPRA